VKRKNRATIFDLTTGVLVNISSGWFGVVLITPIFTAPVLNAENVWFLTKGIFFGIVYLVTAYWVKTRK